MNPYETLGVEPDATQDEIKHAHRRQVSKHHPDRNGGDSESTEKTIELNRAIAIIGDPESRKRYDETGDCGGIKDTNQQAESLLTEMFMRIVGAMDNVEHIDVIKSINININKSIDATKAHISTVNNKIKKLEKIKDRLSSKSGKQILMNQLIRQIKSLNNTVEGCNQYIETADLALEMLDDYEYEFDEVPVQTSTDYRTINFDNFQ